MTKIQSDILSLMQKAKAETFNSASPFALSIDDVYGVVNFNDEGMDFSPSGYDERDTIAGVAIDLQTDEILLLTSDCEGQENFLSINDNEAELTKKDWKLVHDTLEQILSRQLEQTV